MEKIKIKDKKTGAIKEVKKSLVADYLGTNKFVLAGERAQMNKPKNNSFRKEE